MLCIDLGHVYRGWKGRCMARHRRIPWAPRSLIVALVLLLLATLIGVFGALPRLPIYAHSAEMDTAFWVAFWSGLAAGAVLSLSIAVVVTVALDRSKQLLDQQERHDAAERGFQELRDRLRSLFQQTDVSLLDSPDAMIPRHVRQAIDLLDRVPLVEWRHMLPDEAAFFEAVTTFRQAHIHFTGAAQKARAGCEFAIGLCDRQHNRVSGSIASRQSIVMFCLGIACGYLVDECSDLLSLQLVDRAVLQQYLDTMYDYLCWLKSASMCLQATRV
jgi:hypothetical protein